MSIYYISTKTTISTTKAATNYADIVITRITKEKFEGRDHKVFIDAEGKGGPNGVWQKAANAVRDLHNYNEMPIRVATRSRIGARCAKNEAWVANQTKAGFIR